VSLVMLTEALDLSIKHPSGLFLAIIKPHDKHNWSHQSLQKDKTNGAKCTHSLEK